MSKIKFEEAGSAQINVQDVLDRPGVDVEVINLCMSISDGEAEINAFDLECADDVNLHEVISLPFSDPVICERDDIEDAITREEYETLKISDDRRGREAVKLQQETHRHTQHIKRLQRENAQLNDENEDLLQRLKQALKPWWRKIL